MSDVQIAAIDDGLGLVQTHQIVPQIVLPRHAIVQALQAVLGVWGVAADQIELVILQGDEPPLVVVNFLVHAIGGIQGRMGGEHRCAGISLFLCGVPKLQPAFPQLQLGLPLDHLCLLKAEKVGGLPAEEVQKPLVQTGPQAVYIPGNQLHRNYPLAAKDFCP